jgi:6-phosphogluconolactonase (cycloisomerase 2 family)
MVGCGDFWQAPSASSANSFTLTNSAAITIGTGAANGSSTITVTPGSSFTGTVSLSCTVTTSPAGASNPPTCSLYPTSVALSAGTAQTAALTASISSTTTSGIYDITVNGDSGSLAETATVCVAVGVSSSGCTSTAGASGNFYVLSPTSIAGYSISSGTLTPISGSSYSLTGASAMAISPSGNFLYVASLNGITLYTINTSTGALTQGSEVFGDLLAGAIQVDPSGKWLLDASDTGQLNAYPITSSGTEDTSRAVQSAPLSSTSVASGGIAICPNGALVAVAESSPTGTQVFSFMASPASGGPLGTGPITLKPYNTSAGAAISVAFDPLSRLLYVGETAAFNSNSNSGALRVFTVNGNSLTELGYSSPYAPAGTGPHAILPTPDGKYVYAASWESGAAGTISGYSVTTSALTAVGTAVNTGTEPYGLAEDNTDAYVLAVSNSGTTFDAYTFDKTAAGQLDASGTGTGGNGPIAIVAAPK